MIFTMNNGICELYREKAKLKESHIFPKFAIRYHKKTGSTYLRKFIDPNKRIQDGIKLYLLSEKAEQEFSIREKWFSENIFHPYLKGKIELNYNENMFYFIISFLWRTLILNIKSEDLTNKWFYNDLLNAEIEWRNFLTKDIYPKNFDENYMFLTYDFEKNDSEIKGVHYYFARTFDATIVTSQNKENLMVYGKFNRFIFWSILKGNIENSNISDCKINPIKGKIKIPQILDFYPFNSFLGNRIIGIEKLQKPNDYQQEIIQKEILKRPDAFFDSEAGKYIMKDFDDQK